MKQKPYVYGPRSCDVIEECHFLLGQIAHGALAIMNEREDGIDIALTDGARTPAEAMAYKAAGTGVVESKHIPDPSDGKARALDGVPAMGRDPFPRYPDKKNPSKPFDSPAVRADKMREFRIYRGAMLEASDRLDLITLQGVTVYVRSGSDWNCNGIEVNLDEEEKRSIVDFPHIELVFPGEKRYFAARMAKERRIMARMKGEKWPL